MSKIIEIPFGAKDSENKGWEYTIPAGMEAVIEDGKVIVREKESEDERIRKFIMECVDELRKSNPENAEFNGKCSEAIAYLEEQKEQKPSTVEKLREISTPADENWFEIQKKWENEDEQKPAEKQDYTDLNDMERAIHRGFLAAGVEDAPVEIIKETAKECLAQMKPAGWSEEDSRILYNVIAYVGYAAGQRGVRDDEFKEANSWLKSLPERFNPRSHWKPSEEQPECLADVSKMEQDMEGLEKEVARTYHDGSVTDTSDIDHVSYENIAHHFYELGKNARKEEYK